MAFIILGIIIFIVGSALARINDAVRRFGKPVMAAGIALAVLGALTAAIVQVDPGQVGIKILFGRVQPDILYSGLHIINPFQILDKATGQLKDRINILKNESSLQAKQIIALTNTMNRITSNQELENTILPILHKLRNDLEDCIKNRRE